METYNLKAGYILTVVTDALTTADYCLVDSIGPGPITTINVSSTVALGPFTDDRRYGLVLRGTGYTVSTAFASIASDEAAIALKAPIASPTFTGTVTLPIVAMTKVNGTEAAGAVTASGNAGIITTSALTTAAGGALDITWTNTRIAATSVVQLTHVGGTNTKYINLKVVPGSGSAVLTIQNDDLLAALDGTVKIAYMVV
jgi:hypothetical protein